MSRRSLRIALPVLIVQLVAVATLVTGYETLYLRDVLNTHLTMKSAQVAEIADGASGVVDPYRGGGQPLAGNPNALPFYPTTLLFFVASELWALNAHFWLHFLLAPWAMASLSRSLGASRRGAWAAGVTYGLGGYVLSLMSYFNLIAAATIAPAFVAAAVRGARGPRPAAAAAGLLWALSIFAGDPTTTALTLVAAVLAVSFDGGTERLARRRVALAVVAGTGLAAPQWVELLRILPQSTRGFRGFGEGGSTVASFDPRQLLEVVIPFVFGRVDRQGDGAFWGYAVYTDALPYFLTLAPGLVVLLVGVFARWGRRTTRLGLVWVALGLFLALGRFNPLLAPLLGLPGASLLRFPVKAWLLVALGLALLAGEGWERVFEEADPAASLGLQRGAAGVALGLGTAAMLATVGWGPLSHMARAAVPASRPDAFVLAELDRWALTLALLAIVSLAVALVVRFGRRWPRAAGALLLVLHAVSQMFLLAPCLARDEAEPYRARPVALDRLQGRRHIVHGSVGRLFGRRGSSAVLQADDGDSRWLARRAAAEIYPFVGVRWGLRYELARSPEGLDSFLGRLARDAVRSLGDHERLRLLRAWGVEALVVSRPLDDSTGWKPLERWGQDGDRGGVWVPDHPVERVRLVHGVRPAASPRMALGHLLDPGFDPEREVVLAGAGPGRDPGRGGTEVRLDRTDRLEVLVETERDGVLVVDRAHLTIYRAWVDGREVALEVANLYRLAVLVPAGRHEVTIAVDRRPGRAALAASVLAALVLVWLLVPARGGAGSGVLRSRRVE